MKTLGWDIGTTTISAVILDNGAAAEVISVDNASVIPGQPWERLQGPGIILERSMKLVEELLCRHPDTAAIGVTGQMHGILYLDKLGDHVSPLYTWQDGRGDLPCREARTVHM